jgi:hypothetical protein
LPNIKYTRENSKKLWTELMSLEPEVFYAESTFYGEQDPEYGDVNWSATVWDYPERIDRLNDWIRSGPSGNTVGDYLG